MIFLSCHQQIQMQQRMQLATLTKALNHKGAGELNYSSY